MLEEIVDMDIEIKDLRKQIRRLEEDRSDILADARKRGITNENGYSIVKVASHRRRIDAPRMLKDNPHLSDYATMPFRALEGIPGDYEAYIIDEVHEREVVKYTGIK